MSAPAVVQVEDLDALLRHQPDPVGVGLSCGRAKTMALLGRNGAGKSTPMKGHHGHGAGPPRARSP